MLQLLPHVCLVFFKDTDKCTACPENAEICSDATTISFCKLGYTKVVDKCVSCTLN